jgi:hypothetical protein
LRFYGYLQALAANNATLSIGFGDLVAALQRWGHAPWVVILQPNLEPRGLD